ncbi:hypothetical protein ElyMa_004559600 [Elysia marginata]|uniref:Bcl-x interacting BH3 domain-containing protein n=1 Tax=Elysia marginata TaxID=1093978 RepID=A0AAV4HSC1_9GAST|nr:hypothetical protein ElyMa_004559600 [Elysia marginata]
MLPTRVRDRSELLMLMTVISKHREQQLNSRPSNFLPELPHGTAADRLRHYSDGSPAWPGSTPPLPDIVPTCMARDRSASAPDLRARAAGREVGRELRRLSDEFFNTLQQRRRLSPVREDFGGHPASFPRMRVSYVRHIASNFGAFLSETFGSRRGSSVDLSSDEPDL